MDTPERIWANCAAHENWDDLNASSYEVDWWNEYRLTSLPATDAQALANPKVQALVEALKGLTKHRKDILEDIKEAHRNRGDGASQWMREDDREFLSDLRLALDVADATLALATPTPADLAERLKEKTDAPQAE